MERISEIAEIENIDYNKDNKEIIVDYKQNEGIERIAFSFTDESTNDMNNIKSVKTGAELRTWILSNRKTLGINIEIEDEKEITKSEQLLALGEDKKIEWTEEYQDKKDGKNKIIAYYKEGTEIKSVIFSITNRGAYYDDVRGKTLGQWILSNRKTLGINIEIEEKLITESGDLLALGEDKKIEHIEDYQDKKDGKNKIIAYYKEENKLKSVVFSITKRIGISYYGVQGKTL